MTKNIVQLINQNANMDVFMDGKEAVKDVMQNAAVKIKSINDLDEDERLKVALAIFEENERDTSVEALSLDDTNSDVLSYLIKFLKNDDADSAFDFCRAVKKSFINHHADKTEELIDEVIYEEFADKAEEADAKPHVDPINGEIRWY